MAGEIQLNSTTMATESSGSITAELDTIRPNTTNGSLTLQGDSSDAGVTGLTIDSSGVVNTTTAKVTNIQATSGQSLTIKDEGGNAAITIGTDNTAASYLSLNFGSHNSGSGTLTANTLSDYEEGFWTATYIGSTTAGSSPTASQATYARVGNIVVATCSFKNATSSSAVGNMYITGLPYAASSGSGGEHFAAAVQTGLGSDVLGGSVLNGESRIRMRDVLTTVYEPVVNTSGFYLFITMTYTAA